MKKIPKSIIKASQNKENKKITISSKPLFRERDMRQEAMDIGSHQAQEFFGDKNAGPV